MNILTLLIFTPILFGLLFCCCHHLCVQVSNTLRYLLLCCSCVSVYIYICTLKQALRSRASITKISFSLYKNYPGSASTWAMGKMQIEYFVGIDGISVTLLVMTSLVMVIAAIASWEITSNLKGFFALFLLLDMAVVGVFCALDFFLFYTFYELMLLPLYFLIGMWGGARREYAAIKFFLYTLFGSVFMLLVMVGLYFRLKILLPVTILSISST
jgi:NADH-quinone oxidoreductase subunit M